MTRDRDDRKAEDTTVRLWVKTDLRNRYAEVLTERLPDEWLDLLPRG